MFGSNDCGDLRHETKLYIASALVSAMCGRNNELGLYLWGNRPLLTVQEHPSLVSGGCALTQWATSTVQSTAHTVDTVDHLDMVYTVDAVDTVDTAYTLDTAYSVYTIEIYC